MSSLANASPYAVANQHAVHAVVRPAVMALARSSSSLNASIVRACARTDAGNVGAAIDRFERNWWSHGFAIGLPPLRYETPPPSVFASVSKSALVRSDFMTILARSAEAPVSLPVRSRGIPALREAARYPSPDRCVLLESVSAQLARDLDRSVVALDDPGVRMEWFEPDGAGEFFDAFDVTGGLVGQMLDHWDWMIQRRQCGSVPGFATHWRVLLDTRKGLGALMQADAVEERDAALRALLQLVDDSPCAPGWEHRAQRATVSVQAALSTLKLGSTFNARDGD